VTSDCQSKDPVIPGLTRNPTEGSAEPVVYELTENFMRGAFPPVGFWSLTEESGKSMTYELDSGSSPE